MVTKSLFSFKHVYKASQYVLDCLRPYCRRIEVAGSVRRKQRSVGDLEIVCTPIEYETEYVDLFGVSSVSKTRHTGFAETLSQWRRLKGDPYRSKYIQYQMDDGLKIDIFTAHSDNWGLILAIRTGSAQFSHRILACGWAMAGYESKNGMLHEMDTGKEIPVYEEEDLFRLIGLDYTKPEDRE